MVNTYFKSLMILGRRLDKRGVCSYILTYSCAENHVGIYIFATAQHANPEKCIGKEFKYYFHISLNKPTFYVVELLVVADDGRFLAFR